MRGYYVHIWLRKITEHINCYKMSYYTSATDLARERCPIHRLYEVGVHLVGPDDDGGHGLLVLWSRGCQERESRERDAVLAARQTSLIVAVWAQAAAKDHRGV